MRKLFLVVAAAAALSGCATGGVSLMDGIMDSWVGANVDEAINQWGYPTGERTIAGRNLIVWQEDRQLAMPSVSNTTGTVSFIGRTAYVQGTTNTWGGDVTNWSCSRVLEVDAKNTIVGWQHGGNNCPFLEVGPYAKWRRKQ